MTNTCSGLRPIAPIGLAGLSCVKLPAGRSRYVNTRRQRVRTRDWEKAVVSLNCTSYPDRFQCSFCGEWYLWLDLGGYDLPLRFCETCATLLDVLRDGADDAAAYL